MAFILLAGITLIFIVVEQINISKSRKKNEPKAKEFCEMLQKNLEENERVRTHDYYADIIEMERKIEESRKQAE